MGVEKWKAIAGYNGKYLISDTGFIYSNLTHKFLKPHLQPNGYLSVELCNGGKNKRLLLHRIVAMTFLDNPNNYPVVNHKDEDKTNNRASNLEWCTQRYNANYGNALQKKKQNRHITNKVLDALRLGRESNKKPVLQFTKSGEFVNKYESLKAASDNTKINHSHIMETCKRTRKSAGGYIWRYEGRNDLLAF